MLESTHLLTGFSLATEDGEIGSVKDFYFDDQHWNIRYLVVETGNWFFGRKVLISPHAIQGVAWENRLLKVKMTKDQVRSSPSIDTNLPVSKQLEKKLNDYYAWPNYGSAGMGYPTTGMVKVTRTIKAEVEEDTGADKHLRSYRHVRDYKVYNADGFLGETADFLVDTADWTLPYLVIEMADAEEGEMIAIPSDQIASIDFSTYAVAITQGREQLKKISAIL
ncbi:PRC-barrel domain-containing protein [Pedobacter sp. SAFR-022]|uniref:PRC-barrel domain-containing protein n=1 Tax=Pedobacter sp. SAFR-022 TaxID=3436861 RepID=UPI003F7DA019